MKKRNCSRLISMMLAVALLLPLMMPMKVSAATGGNFGAGLSWNLKDGCLTISGDGAIPDYADLATAPWYDLRYEVEKLILQDGITEIGDFALFGLENLTSVSLPESLTAIGNQSMAYMGSLVTLKLPASVKTLGAACFGNCASLKNLYVYRYDAEFVWLPFGFRYDAGVNDYVPIEDVTLYGYMGSTAESYAAQYANVTFSPLNSGGISGSHVKTELEERTDSRDLIHIRTVDELKQIADAPDAHYVLDNDLNLSGEWETIPLSGTFEGQGHTIRGLNMANSATGHYGLFSTLSGAVSNLTVEGTIRASGMEWIAAGLLAADCTEGSLIDHCTVSGSVEVEAGIYGYAGGMVGRNGSFENCTVEADVSLTTTDVTEWAHVGGLSAIAAVLATDCAYKGGLTLTQAASAPNLQADLRGIAAGKCIDCTVEGTMNISTLDCRYASVIALEHAVSSVNRASINASTQGEVNVTACSGVVGCRNEGSVTVSHSGSNGNALAVGMYQVADSVNTGSISATSENTDAHALAMDATYGDEVSNSGSVTVSAANGSATAYGVRGSAESSVNTAAISAEGKTASATGAYGGITSDNSGDVTATGEDASAVGVSGGSNSGEIKANASTGAASAYGVYLGSNLGGSNTAEITAISGSGTASAWGVNGGMNYTNSAAVFANGWKALAYGIDGCSYSCNNAAISVACNGGEGSTAQAIGVSGGVGNENRGGITAKTAAELNKAVGCLGSSKSSSSGSISASGNHEVNAFALQNCTDSYSSGTVTANCDADGEDDFAAAYGHTGGSRCSSDASVSAYSDYFIFEITRVDPDGTRHYHWGGSGCLAGNAASASLVIPGLFNIQQSGDREVDYYAWLTTDCAIMGVFDRPPTEDEVRNNEALQFHDPDLNISYYYYITASVRTEGDSDGWTPPQPPEPEKEEEKQPADPAAPYSLGFYYRNEEDCRISVMTNALGSFSFFNGCFDDIYDPASTDYRTVYLRLQCFNDDLEDSAEGNMTLFLPDGFSFAQDSYERTMEITVPALQSFDTKDIWIPVYPMFSLDDYEDNDVLECSYIDSKGNGGMLSTGCKVNIPSGTAGQARVNYFFEKVLSQYYYVDYEWEEGIFEQDNTTFHQNINELAALLSTIIYFTNDDPTDALDSLAALGFSCLRAGGSNTIQDCRHIVAQKTLLDENGKPQQLVAMMILGTSNAAGWVGNLTFLDDLDEHMTFLSAAQSAVKTLNSHLDGYLASGQERKLLITGHSRGAAAANLVGDMVNQQYAEMKEDIYVYTYATPKAVKAEVAEAAASRNTNIFNIINFYDLVGYVPGCFERHGMTMFYETEEDNYAPMYIIPLKEITTESLSQKRFVAAFGIGAAVPNYNRILKYHLMNYYVEDIWRIMPEQIYTYDAAMTYMEQGYRRKVAEMFGKLAENGAVRLSDMMDYMVGVMGDAFDQTMSDLFTSYRYDLGENTSVPLNMAEFFNQPVMEAPLEINCPVDLKIYDESGTLLGEVKDDAILLGSEHFILSVVEDKKSLLLRKDMTYIIEITGYDEGTMDMQLLQSEGEDSVKALAYKDVSVSPETTLTAELRNGVLSLTDGRSQVIEPEVISADELQMVEIAIETDDENVTVKGSGSYIAGQQILLMANNSDKNAVFAGWYEDDVLVARSATACISCDRSMTLTPKYLEDVTETMILAVSHDSNSVTATVVCSETAVLYAAAYDENGQMLWTNSASAVTGVIEIPAPASVLGKVHEIRAFLLEPATMRPLCQYGN